MLTINQKGEYHLHFTFMDGEHLRSIQTALMDSIAQWEPGRDVYGLYVLCNLLEAMTFSESQLMAVPRMLESDPNEIGQLRPKRRQNANNRHKNDNGPEGPLDN
ncbi:MAG: hypothetical protein AAF399_00250 [Bacteroidota bacterium]